MADTTPTNARAINIEDLADGDLLRWDADEGEFVRLAPAAAVSIPALTSSAITGGESPTEAEHNALRTDVAALRTALAALQTAQVTAGTMHA